MYSETVKINYEESFKNNFKCGVNQAVKFYLNLNEEDSVAKDCGIGFILYPQALNPFLKIMETLKESDSIVIIPSFNNDIYEKLNEPAYLILKLPLKNRRLDNISIFI